MARESRMNRRTVLRAGGLGALAAGLGLLAAQPAQAQRGRHPRLRRAIDDLRDAKAYLQEAPHDFGGHRRRAIEAIDRAIEQLERAIKF